MHVIWSKGQETNSKLPDYYLKDELKYHGGGGAQRGWREVNFRGQYVIQVTLCVGVWDNCSG